MNNVVQIPLLSKSQCDDVIKHGYTYQLIPGGLVNSENHIVQDYNLRRCNYAFMPDMKKKLPWFEPILKNVVAEANKQWKLPYDDFKEQHKFIVYHVGDHLEHWHRDNEGGVGYLGKRQISIAVLLNDDYEGGNFEYKDAEGKIKILKNTVGDAIIFPSSDVSHHITKVTRGCRFVLLNWVSQK